MKGTYRRFARFSTGRGECRTSRCTGRAERLKLFGTSQSARRLIQAMVNPHRLAGRMDGFDYLLLEPLPVAVPRRGRRTARTLPLLPPPQKN